MLPVSFLFTYCDGNPTWLKHYHKAKLKTCWPPWRWRRIIRQTEPDETPRPALETMSGTAPQIRMAEGLVFLPLHKRRRAAAGQALAAAHFPFAAPAAAYESYDFRRLTNFPKTRCAHCSCCMKTLRAIL